MTGDTNRLLRLLCIVSGRSVEQCAIALACSPATVKRMVRDLRDLGVAIRSAPWHSGQEMKAAYVVDDYGPFNVQALRQLRLPVLPQPQRFRTGSTVHAVRPGSAELRS